MTPTSPAQKFGQRHSPGIQIHCTPSHSSSQWHWEVQQSLEWPALKWRSTPAWGYNITHCSMLCEAEASTTSLFPPSPLQDLQLGTTRKSQGQEVRRAIYCTWRVTGFFLGPSWPGEKRGRLFIFAKGWETWMSEAMPCMSNIGLGLEGRAWLLSHC